jgi:hypothetical protein
LYDFITPDYIHLFSKELINNPTLLYSYKNERNDTLEVAFEPQDHPFFENEDSSFAIKENKITFVWRKNKFVRIE